MLVDMMWLVGLNDENNHLEETFSVDPWPFAYIELRRLFVTILSF